MEIPVKDRSNYLKGLLIVARKDKQLADSEKKIIREIADNLGFAAEFYESVLKDLLINKYILEDPIKFSNLKIAKCFIDDGLKLAFSDNSSHKNELNWLLETAKHNHINEDWFKDKLTQYESSSSSLTSSGFAIHSIIGK